MAAESHLSSYAAALLRDSYYIAGVRMEPLTVGHILLLHRLEHPLVIGKGTLDASRIVQAAALCSVPYATAVRAVESRWLRLRLWWVGWRMRKQIRPFGFAHLVRYLAEGCRGPKTWVPADAGGRRLNTPFWVTVQVTLMRDLGMSKAEALATPAREAVWLCSAIWEAAGAIEMASEAELSVMSESRN
jgi:hypothetical protein